MQRPARLLAVFGLLCGLAALRLPLWEVRLGAPQYPEGLGLRILAHTVTGLGPNDLENINSLNHYIGMKAITPETIPELRILPWAIGILIASGILAAIVGSRRGLKWWLGISAVGAVAGLADFWWWEYDYGHNLNMEQAIIVVPGMSYQPPLIGSKQLLNFVAYAWPGTGAAALAVAALAVVGAIYLSRPKTV